MKLDGPPPFSIPCGFGVISTVFAAGCLFDPMGSPGATDTVETVTGTTESPLTGSSTDDPTDTSTGPGDASTGDPTSTTTGETTAAATGPGTTGSSIDEPFCGDGVVQPDINETCDDGNLHNDDACTNFCEPQSCGDKFIDLTTEECDDGMQLSLGPDACSDDCKCQLQACGDGVLDMGEECDDGNKEGRDGCSACCQRLRFNVFVTSQKFTGAELGGLGMADARCTAAAAAAGLPGEYQAWLGVPRGIPSPLMLEFYQPYALVGTADIVTYSLKHLRSGALEHAIVIDEHGQDIGPVPEDPCSSPELRVWTGTEEDGESVFDATCGMWQDAGQVGRVGAAGSATDTWADCEVNAPCDVPARLYCFEVQT